MALSDEERRRLDKLEQELAAADPNLDRKLQSGVPGVGGSARRAAWAALAVLPGFVLVMVGIITQLTVVGGVGFLFMVLGAHWFLPRRR